MFSYRAFVNVLLQKSKEIAAAGIMGPEGHELCRPEEVCDLFNYMT